MLIDSLYHPPKIKYSVVNNNILKLEHEFEGKQLYSDYIENVLIGIEYLWGHPVTLETFEFSVEDKRAYYYWLFGLSEELEYKRKKVKYHCKDRKVTRQVIPE